LWASRGHRRFRYLGRGLFHGHRQWLLLWSLGCFSRRVLLIRDSNAAHLVKLVLLGPAEFHETILGILIYLLASTLATLWCG
jgi:hypothetical protein